MSAGIIFMIMNTIAESIYPNYSVGSNAISDLGAVGQSTRYLWDGQLLVSGILGLVGALIFLFRSSFAHRSEIRGLVKIIYLLPPIASIVVSLVPENTISAIHSLAALTEFVSGGISAIYAYRFTDAPFRYFSILLGATSLSSVVLLESASSILGFGGAERLVVYPFVIWSVAFGGYLVAQKTALSYRVS